MKKDRNAFFNEANFQSSSFVGNPNMPNMNYPNYPMNGNFSGSQASQSFYSGPVPMNYNPTMGQNMNNDSLSDFESRMAKMERQINRLDARVSKLESKGLVTTENFDNTTNMYML